MSFDGRTDVFLLGVHIEKLPGHGEHESWLHFS